MKAWFTRIRLALSGILINLKHKFGKPQLQKFAALLHARMQAAKEWLKESYLIVKCALLIFAIKLYMALTPEALKGYWEWIKNLPSQFTKENFKKWWAAFLVWLKTLPETFKGLRKSGVLASLTLFALLLFMGHSATTAWLTYTTKAERNTFEVGKMALHVEYKNDNSFFYDDLDDDEPIFNDKALYEPGYTQVVRLKIENDGTVPFEYKLSVTSYESKQGQNVYGQMFDLAKSLKFGVIFAETDKKLEELFSPRGAAQELANKYANIDLHDFSEISKTTLNGGDTEYAALIVWMPEYVGNEANYREIAPEIKLGLTVYAQQAGTMNLE